MFYVMYISDSRSLDQLGNIFKRLLQENMSVISESEKEIIISTDGFTLRITVGGDNVVFASEDYLLKFDCCCWFDIVNSYSFWAEELMQFTSGVLNSLSGNVVLEANGDNPILLREKGMVYIDKNIGNGSFPFDFLNVTYVERSLIRE